MSRCLEDLGMIMGSSLVKAMRDDAFATAFCISTDASLTCSKRVCAGWHRLGG